MRSMIDRFNEKYELAASGCWLWTSTVSGGYGYFWLNGCQKLAHRVSWEIESAASAARAVCFTRMRHAALRKSKAHSSVPSEQHQASRHMATRYF
jgi:hypothetical protein